MIQELEQIRFRVNYDPDENQLNVGFVGDKVADGDVCLKQAAVQIAQLYDAMVQHGGGQVLKVHGRLSALIAAHIGTVFGNAFPAVAVFDTSLDKFVIISSRVERYSVADKIEKKVD